MYVFTVEDEVEDEDAYDVKNLTQKFTNIGKGSETKVKYERPSDLDEIKVKLNFFYIYFPKIEMCSVKSYANHWELFRPSSHWFANTSKL